MHKFALPLRHFCHLLYSFRLASVFQNARNSCQYLYFLNVQLVYRWFFQVFTDGSKSTIFWTAFWQLIDKDTTWTFQKFFSFSHINCPMSMLSGIATQKYMSKNLSLPTWKFIREGCSKEAWSIFTTQTYSEAPQPIFCSPNGPETTQTFKLKNCLFPNTQQKIHFFGTYLPFGWTTPFFSKYLMTFNHPNLTIYLPWSSLVSKNPNNRISLHPKTFREFFSILHSMFSKKPKRRPRQSHVPLMSILSNTSPFLNRSFSVRC